MKLPSWISQAKTPKLTPSDLTHITQEMYKKNFELAEKNKMLSILRAIDEVILSTVTDIGEIAQHVADLIVREAEFKAVFIFIYDRDAGVLQRLAKSETNSLAVINNSSEQKIFRETISLEKDHNSIEQVVNSRKPQITTDLTDLLDPIIDKEHMRIIQENLSIKSSIIYPLIVRGEVLGSIVFSLSEQDKNFAPFQREFIERLVDVIGIALDNALLYKRIQDANEKLKELDKMKDEFVSLASHELRTPMTIIKSYLWMTINGKGGELTEKQRFYVTRAYVSTDRLITFVNEMLNVSRIESNRVSISLKPIAIDSFAAEIISEMEPKAQELGVTLSLIENEQVPLVLADADKIREVITNLLGNSLKFTPRGGSVTLSFKQSGEFVECDVSDTGQGMEEDEIPKLFHKFSMIGDNYLTKTSSQGTGLGLYISKSIVELHGGSIWATSEGKGKGSCFSFTLKKARDASA